MHDRNLIPVCSASVGILFRVTQRCYRNFWYPVTQFQLRGEEINEATASRENANIGILLNEIITFWFQIGFGSLCWSETGKILSGSPESRKENLCLLSDMVKVDMINGCTLQTERPGLIN